MVSRNKENPLKSKSPTLFVRQGDHVSGPYARGLIRNSVLTGKLKVDDQVSADGESWYQIQADQSLIPKEIRQRQNREKQKQLQQIRELSPSSTTVNQVSSSELENGVEQKINDNQATQYKIQYKIKRQFIGLAALLFAVLLAIVVVAIKLKSSSEQVVQQVDCNSSARPGVIWRNCRMEGLRAQAADLKKADLSNTDLRGADFHGANLQFTLLYYANLSGANLTEADFRFAKLIGAGLRNADLTNANLDSADLSYANLKGAKINGASMKDTKLERTIWIDGTICRIGSIGSCRK